MAVAAVIVSAGRGVRFGGDLKKQFLTIGGRSVLAWTLSAFETTGIIDEIIVVAGQEDLEFVRELAGGYSKVTHVVPGGGTRQSSCWNGLSRLGENISHVAVHDGVRPCVTPEVIDLTVRTAMIRRAAVAALPLSDTVVLAGDEMSRPCIGKVLDRRKIWRLQTPQAFELELLRKAALQARQDKFAGTDESSLVRRLGEPVYLVKGRYDNIKLTTPDDLALAEAVLLQRSVKSEG